MSTAPDQKRITAMRQGGKLLGSVKHALELFAVAGVSFEAIEAEAQRLIRAGGALPSFSTVPGYSWATCIMKNHELCHGIPEGKQVAAGDVITIDVGLIFQGFHLDTTTTFAVGKVPAATKEFLSIGQKALRQAIAVVAPGASVYSVSHAMERVLEKARFGAVYQLTGHGIGAQLHMEPSIPVVAQSQQKHELLREGQTLAVEVMYTMGEPHLELAPDKWTYQTVDGSLSGMFEETVLVVKSGFEILT
jgi:methionyl aminopeptidase